MIRKSILELHVKLDGNRVSSQTNAICTRPYVLSILTVLCDDDVFFRLISTFVRKPRDTHVVHLVLGSPGEDAELHAEDQPHDRLDPTHDPSGCAYEHIHVLMEALRSLGHQPTVDLPDDVFHELQRIEH